MDRDLYASGTLLRMHGMRRTLFVFPADVAPAIHAGAASKIAAAERARTLREIGDAGIADDPVAWLAEVEASTLKALRARGEATANELGQDEPRLRTQMLFNVGKKYEGTVGVSTRLLFTLALEGLVARGRPAGSWVSSQYRWIPIEAVIPGGFPPLDPEVAPDRDRPALAGGLRPGHGRRHPLVHGLDRWPRCAGSSASSRSREVDLDGTTGPRPRRRRGVRAGARAVRAPSCPDSTRRSWAGPTAGSSWPATPSHLFDTNGNAGPTVWWDGRIVGGWAQRPDGEIAHRLLEDPGADGRAAIEAEGARLREWLGPTRVTPRFRTLFERELAGT